MKEKILKTIRTLAAVLGTVATIWLFWEAFVFLRTSPRLNVQKISVSGLQRVKENEVVAKAGYDVGNNLFRVNLDAIRMQVETLAWVRHAVVRRVFPDEIAIRVIERHPIGLARIGGEVFQIDDDAAILDTDPSGVSNAPVLEGLNPGDPEGNLKKVAAYRQLLVELPPDELSEVKITEAGDVSVVANSDPMTVQIGRDEFRTRWVKYLQLKGQIREQYPEAVTVDLRFRNQVIIRLRDDMPEFDVVWDEKKKSL